MTSSVPGFASIMAGDVGGINYSLVSFFNDKRKMR